MQNAVKNQNFFRLPLTRTAILHGLRREIRSLKKPGSGQHEVGESLIKSNDVSAMWHSCHLPPPHLMIL
jgi:hypothetical protein